MSNYWRKCVLRFKLNSKFVFSVQYIFLLQYLLRSPTMNSFFLISRHVFYIMSYWILYNAISLKCSYRNLNDPLLLVRFWSGCGQILSRVVFNEEETLDAVPARYSLFRSHRDSGQNCSLLERDPGIIWLDGTSTLRFQRVPPIFANRCTGFESQSSQDSIDQTLWMGHRHRAFANRRHVLLGK